LYFEVQFVKRFFPIGTLFGTNGLHIRSTGHKIVIAEVKLLFILKTWFFAGRISPL